MFLKLYDALILLGTPSRWPVLARRLFVILCPITVPLLILLWMALIGAFIAIVAAGCLWCILMEFVNSMRTLWDGER